ncbi:MAG: phytanoyl-CoA dioxygenase family protein [Gammaproteobacteria bacterium]|nr:phytanoyl-CoA dioxygenase family protein [Gammaproteobacteria bacterium]MYE81051.1 phytanoyl-CoA dioxygenase family protein [Gammaproteobacteria bacterium]
MPGGAAQVVHTDQTYIPEPWTYAAVGNVIWMADDFTEANGATRTGTVSANTIAGPSCASRRTS